VSPPAKQFSYITRRGGFLTEESQLFDSPQRPIDALKAGKTDEVIAAARASGEAFT
jgi:hypothetical protein